MPMRHQEARAFPNEFTSQSDNQSIKQNNNSISPERKSDSVPHVYFLNKWVTMEPLHINEFLCFMTAQFNKLDREHLISMLVDSYVLREAVEAKNTLIAECEKNLNCRLNQRLFNQTH